MVTAAATGMSRHTSREARHRRILEQGSDRLALITCRIQSLPPDPDQPFTHSARHEDVASGLALPNNESSTEPSKHHVFEETGAPLPLNTDKGKNMSSTKTREPSPLNQDEGRSISFGETGEPLMLSSDEIVSSRIATTRVREEGLSQISSSTRSTAQNHQCAKSLRNSHTTPQIRSAIAATENVRMWFSVTAAILVILSRAGFPILCSPSIRRTILLRPLYLLLLTNITVVLTRVIPQGAGSRTGQTCQRPAVSGNAQLGRTIEACFLLQKISTALFMDFGFYAVLLICGLSLIQRIGW